VVTRCCASIPQDFYILALAASFVLECEIVDDCSVPLSSSLRILLFSLSRCGCVQVYSRTFGYSVADFEFKFRFLLHGLIDCSQENSSNDWKDLSIGLLCSFYTCPSPQTWVKLPPFGVVLRPHTNRGLHKFQRYKTRGSCMPLE
jgi:hypothetical protein